MGLLKGVGDLYVNPPGHPPGWLEFKTPGAGQTIEQKAFQELCRANGSRYQVVYSLDHALSVLQSWKALRTREAAE